MKIVKRKSNMTDPEWKNFFKTIVVVTEEGCWETNYYKYVNTRGQARLYYKNKNIFLYQLSHLVFNGDVSNLDSIFHICDNLICFNPEHLTDDLKEKQFKEKMSGKELLEGGLIEKDIEKILIDYGNWLFKKLGRPLVFSDFEVKGRISYTTIIKYFDDSMGNYFNSCDFLPVKRKVNMTDSEMREFLKDKKTVTEKGCWITDYWKVSRSDERIKIQYRGKYQFLYRIAYVLFKGNIFDGLEATHSCDNPSCYNPDHIVPDTHKGNMEGAAERGRAGGPTGKKRKPHKITNPYNYEALLNFVKQHIEITEKDEWIFPTPSSQEYPTIQISRKAYQLHRLILANKLGKKYEEIDVSCHVLSDGSKPDKRDVNPDHLFEDTDSGNALDTAKYSESYKLDKDKANRVKDAAAKFDFSKWGSKTSFDREWAAKLNVSRSCIKGIRSGRNWNQL